MELLDVEGEKHVIELVNSSKEALYLGSGNVPIRFILMARQVNFLHYIMNEEEESLLNRFFKAQWECFDTKNGCSLSSL